jgi:hypothetical protein
VKAITRKRLEKRKRKIDRRLDRKAKRQAKPPRRRGEPVMNPDGKKYEVSEKSRGLVYGGIGVMHRLAQRTGLIEAIDGKLHLLKVHRPYQESDHVMNFAFNALCEGTCLEDIELRRQDEVFLDALGAETIPDPTTAGDFCRRFSEDSVRTLMGAIDEARGNVWREQPDEFFDEAVIDVDGSLVVTTGECKDGMDISYKGTWGYHPLLVTLANTGELLSLVNRSGNKKSEDGAAAEIDRAIRQCVNAGFRRVLVRGDTAFSQTEYLDGWHDEGVVFCFGYKAMPNLKELAENLPETAWKKLDRPAKSPVKTTPRRKPPNVKRRVIRDREYLHLELKSEEVAEFRYQPTACRRGYRMIVVRKNISQEKGDHMLFDEVRYFFYITNEEAFTPAEIVYCANDRCDQENLIAQLAGGVRSLAAPVDNLVSNWAYMVMTSLAWTLKAWAGLLLPVGGRWREKHQAERREMLRMEFKTFVNAFMKIPCQIVRGARRTVFRVLNWNPRLSTFFRLCTVLKL